MKLTILAGMTLLAILAGAGVAPQPAGPEPFNAIPTSAKPAGPQATAAPDAKVLTKLLEDFLAGAGRNDAAMHDRFWADDLIYTSATGTRRGKPELMNGVRSAPPQAGPATTYSAEDVRIQQYGDTAIVAFRLVASGPPVAPQLATSTVTRFFNTGTFLKRNNEWRAVAWQATRIPDPQAAPQPR